MGSSQISKFGRKGRDREAQSGHREKEVEGEKGEGRKGKRLCSAMLYQIAGGNRNRKRIGN